MAFVMPAVGAAGTVYEILEYALVQHNTPDRLRGRMVSVLTAQGATGGVVGDGEVALVAKWFSPAGAAFVNGVVCAAAAVAVAVPGPRKATLPREEPEDAEPLTALLANLNRLREEAARLGVPVVYTAQPGGQTPEQRGLQQDFWGPGVPDDPRAVAIADAVAPEPGDIRLTKWKYSAFVRTDLLELLREQGRDQLVITGVYAHIGVLMTACDAWMSDVQAFVVADAVADFSEREHKMALEWAAGRCAVVTTTEQVF
ncbi:isochorismatase family protein [Streptomyces sp. NPDC012950]|uniref:isochorismatase family protein n=1 Tax=Streptomyces sp. NPDC012950 TaxID=3364858 RepID=UPI0036ADA985